MTDLDAVAVRVVGALIEKENTTPDNYPLTLNALVSACNQMSNRDPVMALEESTVANGIEDLTKRGLVREVYRNDSRAKRYRQTMSESMSLHPAETAVMCVLMLRGAQTAGEIRTRAARLFEFPDLARVDVTLRSLMTLTTPLVAQLPRRPGQKEVRYAHLLSGEPQDIAARAPEPAVSPAATGAKAAELNRIEELEQVVESLRAEMAQLRAQFEEFRQQFQ